MNRIWVTALGLAFAACAMAADSSVRTSQASHTLRLPVGHALTSRSGGPNVPEVAPYANAGDANAHYLLASWPLNARDLPDVARESQEGLKHRPRMAEASTLFTALNVPVASPLPARESTTPPAQVAPPPATGSTAPPPSSTLSAVPGWIAGKPADLASRALDAAAAGDIPRALTLFHPAAFPATRQPGIVRWAYLEVQLQRVFELANAGKCDEVNRGIDVLGTEDKTLAFTAGGFGDMMKGARFQFEVGLLQASCIGEKDARKRWEKVSRLRPPISSPDFAYPYLALAKLGPVNGLGLVIQQLDGAVDSAAPADQPALLYSRGLLFWALGKTSEAGAAFRQGEAKAPPGMLRYLNQNASRALTRAKE